ncbi:acetylcholine receptor subunit beta-type unc-29-like [Ostrinia nubilalis]|uniref:acetylcholine receptor subunit beta-type unc-29-like n=1 Tax=Ostrinia nubilalis TaxID=29057 RepID=UPI0030822CCD
MVWLGHLIFLNLLYLFKCDCVINHQPLEELWQKQLHKDLHTDYKWENPNQCNVTEVKLRFNIHTFELDTDSDIFTVHGAMKLSWNDKRLKWDPKQYGDIKETYFRRIAYWVPFVELNNPSDEDEKGMDYEVCKIKSKGDVVCAPRYMDSTKCATKIGRWPYDTQECTLEYRITKFQKNVHLNTREGRDIEVMELEGSTSFSIVKHRLHSNVSDDVQLRITFVLIRNGESFAAIIIMPLILLSILTVSSIILDVNDRNRFLLIIFSMVCHCFHVFNIERDIPRKSSESPTILWFYRSSWILTMILMTVTVILMKFRNKLSTPPRWVIYVNSKVLKSPRKYLIWPRWESNMDYLTTDDVQVKDVDAWNMFANIVNSVCIFIAVVVYSIMIPVCIPMQH